MHGSVEQVGELLRRTREEKDLTLEQVEQEIKVRTKYLAAMEEGRFDVLPGEVYARGFLRNYANLLGLDSQAVVAQFKAAAAEEAARLGTAREESVGKARKPAGRPSRGPGTRAAMPVGRAVISLVLVAIVVVGVASYLRGRSAQQPGSPPAQGTQPGTGTPGVPPGNVTPPPETRPPRPEVAKIVIDPERTRYIVPGDALELTVRWQGDCWVRVSRDEVVAFEGTLRSGDTRVFQAGESIVIRAGNPGGIAMECNGADLGVAGEVGIPKWLEIVRKKQ